ncbi:unnamed protein product [Hydatigera taeniaeformis]|uniref:WD_REPEATS_REGION domain-containing protein n=1 Tax=Hydatigena taeniaeformis TaxID=6205 RepID=A0A0R3X823_HYDTA|nr:unnamed protein product [Hydatigera taeniaeformis]
MKSDESVAMDTVSTERLYAVCREDVHEFLDNDVAMTRLSDANMERLSCGSLTSVEFNRAYRVVMTTSVDTTMSLFTLGSSGSHLLADFVFEKFPISAAKFTCRGEKVVLTGRRHYFKVYDLSSNKESHPIVPLSTHYEEKIDSVQISPISDVAAFSGSEGVYLVDLRTFEKTATARVSGTVVSHCFAQDGDILNAFSSDGSVFMFDLRYNARPMRRWNDYGYTGGCSLATSHNSKFIACGSESGYVNIYAWEAVMTSSTRCPKPLKSVGNLTTAVDQLLFHPSDQLLYMSSSLQSAAARLVGQPFYGRGLPTLHCLHQDSWFSSRFASDGFFKTIICNVDAAHSTGAVLNHQLDD